MRQRGGQRVVAWLVAGLVFAWALPSWAQSWSYRRETDEMTDRTNHFASVRVGSGYRPAVFFAACRNDDLEMWLAPNDYIGSSDDNGPETSRDDSRIYIDYRVNDEPAQEGRLANLSTDEDAFFFQDHADIIRGLIGKRLIVKWRDYRGTSTTLTIPTRGAAAALKKLPCARPYIPNCGDGETQLGEECDEGRKNSNGRGAVCRRDCTYAPAVCGDGAVQHDEVCDSGVPLASAAVSTVGLLQATSPKTTSDAATSKARPTNHRAAGHGRPERNANDPQTSLLISPPVFRHGDSTRIRGGWEGGGGGPNRPVLHASVVVCRHNDVITSRTAAQEAPCRKSSASSATASASSSTSPFSNCCGLTATPCSMSAPMATRSSSVRSVRPRTSVCARRRYGSRSNMPAPSRSSRSE